MTAALRISGKSIANIGDDFDVFGKDDQSSLLDLLHGYVP